MNGAHFHLVVNHLPIIFPVVGIIVMLTGLIFKSQDVKRTAYLIFFIGMITAIAAMTSGEGAEEVVENINGVNENYIEFHEEAAERFSMLTYILGALSLFGFWASIKQKSFSHGTNIAILIFAFVVIFFGREAGTTGGEIRHTEIRANDTAPPANQNHSENEHD
jgi:uncharacterized membrane protein